MGLTRREIRAVAEVWAAGLLLQANSDAFSQSWGISDDDQDQVLKHVDLIARRLLRGREQKFSLWEVIKAYGKKAL